MSDASLAADVYGFFLTDKKGMSRVRLRTKRHKCFPSFPPFALVSCVTCRIYTNTIVSLPKAYQIRSAAETIVYIMSAHDADTKASANECCADHMLFSKATVGTRSAAVRRPWSDSFTSDMSINCFVHRQQRAADHYDSVNPMMRKLNGLGSWTSSDWYMSKFATPANIDSLKRSCMRILQRGEYEKALELFMDTLPADLVLKSMGLFDDDDETNPNVPLGSDLKSPPSTGKRKWTPSIDVAIRRSHL